MTNWGLLAYSTAAVIRAALLFSAKGTMLQANGTGIRPVGTIHIQRKNTIELVKICQKQPK